MPNISNTQGTAQGSVRLASRLLGRAAVYADVPREASREEALHCLTLAKSFAERALQSIGEATGHFRQPTPPDRDLPAHLSDTPNDLPHGR